MERQIFEIGRGKYKFNKRALNAFIEESKLRESALDRNGSGTTAAASYAGEANDKELQCILDEVMALYRDYMRSESVDLLVLLKCRLEEVSTRYQSHVLAGEVLNIISCLPYERRVPCDKNSLRH